MKHHFSRLLGCAAVAVLASPLLIAQASDHGDPSTRFTDLGAPSDIGDLYTWIRGEGDDRTLVIAMTVAGGVAPVQGQDVSFDRDVLYGVHVDRNGDHVADSDILLRFAQASSGSWGVQVTGLPGTTDVVVGAVGETLTDGSASIYTGLRDDPFFFDNEGLLATLATEALSFDAGRDSFAGMNTSAIVLEMPLDAVLAGGDGLSLWGTTARIGE